MTKISASILASDFARLGEMVTLADRAGADYIHVDVMDGHFVPNLTLGPVIVQGIRPYSRRPFDVHLMIEDPGRYVPEFAKAGANILTVQQEACTHLHRVVQQIKEHGMRAGVALNPATPVGTLEEILPYIDLVLVMTVNPGFGGQEFIPTMPRKIQAMRQMIDRQGLEIELEVDGGIHTGTAPIVVAAGAQVLVAGTAVFCDGTDVEDGLRKLRESMQLETKMASAVEARGK